MNQITAQIEGDRTGTFEVPSQDPLVDMGRRMIAEVLAKIDKTFKAPSPEAKEELAKHYAEGWLSQADGSRERAMELARQSRTPVMVPSGMRTRYNDWETFNNQFVNSLQDFQTRFMHNGVMDKEALANAVALNVMVLSHSDDADLVDKASNLCDLLAMTEQLKWKTDNDVVGDNFLTYSATRFWQVP
jgi:hypothetical protein